MMMPKEMGDLRWYTDKNLVRGLTQLAHLQITVSVLFWVKKDGICVACPYGSEVLGLEECEWQACLTSWHHRSTWGRGLILASSTSFNRLLWNIG